MFKLCFVLKAQDAYYPQVVIDFHASQRGAGTKGAQNNPASMSFQQHSAAAARPLSLQLHDSLDSSE